MGNWVGGCVDRGKGEWVSQVSQAARVACSSAALAIALPNRSWTTGSYKLLPGRLFLPLTYV